MCCTTELWLSVDKREKDNKQRRNDVSVQCLCNVHSVQNACSESARVVADLGEQGDLLWAEYSSLL